MEHIPEEIIREWIEKAKPLVDSAFNLGYNNAITNCLGTVYIMLKDLPEPNPLLIAISNELSKLKKPTKA